MLQEGVLRNSRQSIKIWFKKQKPFTILIKYIGVSIESWFNYCVGVCEKLLLEIFKLHQNPNLNDKIKENKH